MLIGFSVRATKFAPGSYRGPQSGQWQMDMVAKVGAMIKKETTTHV